MLVEIMRNKNVLGFKGHFQNISIIKYYSDNNKPINTKINPLLNIYVQQLKNLICEEIDDKWDDKWDYKEDKFTPEEDITQQDREDDTDNNNQDRLTDDIEELK